VIEEEAHRRRDQHGRDDPGEGLPGGLRQF
jgi:hypothetical protein